MNWHVKVAAYQLLSTLPGGRTLYRLSQERLTKSLVPTRARLQVKIAVGLRYLDWIDQNRHAFPLQLGTHLDFGAGWHPTIPLLYYSSGVERQNLLDISPVLNQALLEQTVDVYRAIASEELASGSQRLKRLPPRMEKRDWRVYLESLGITYHAPYAEAFPPLAKTVDVATSTQVLLHIPREPLLECLRQIHSALKSGGLFLATVHLQDLLSGGGLRKGTASYKHLRYSPAVWDRWFSSSLMSYSRLRATDYRDLLEQTGFDIRHFEVEPGTADDLEELARTRIHPFFERYSRDDLAARHLFFVAQKR